MPTNKEASESTKEGGQTPGGTQARAEVQPRKLKYMFAPRGRGVPFSMVAGPQSLYDAQQIHDALDRTPDIDVNRRIKPSRTSTFAGDSAASQDIVVAATTPRQGLYLQNSAQAGMIVERDHPVLHLTDFGPRFVSQPPAPLRVGIGKVDTKFHVQDAAGKPVPNALIWICIDDGSEAQNATDANGDVIVRVPGGSLDQVTALYVKPASGCWEKFISIPALDPERMNIVTLRPLSEFKAAGFPDNPFLGWGQRLMGLGVEGTNEFTGRGAKIAIIDSGCDNNHPALRHIRIGRDYLNLDRDGNPNENSWNADLSGHGTHSAGIIAGNGETGHIRGFSPQAEIHVLKLFPGGSCSDLIAALYYCIDNQIDVVSCSLWNEEQSEIVQQVLELAREAGVAVVTGAGNSGGPVHFPGQASSVFHVGAIGLQGRYPDDTWHAQTVQPGSVLVNGLFPATFSYRGPEIKVCGPGVAVISSTPGGGYASWDGGSRAAAAVAGFAGLIVGHHPIFADKSLPRNAARVDRIFQIIMASAEPTGLSPFYAGAGLPKVANALMRPLVPDLQAVIQEGLMAGFATLQHQRNVTSMT